MSMVGTQDRGLEIFISGGLVGKNQRAKYRARHVRRGRGVCRALKSGGVFSTDVSTGHVFVTCRNTFGCQMHWYLSQLQKATQAVIVGDQGS